MRWDITTLHATVLSRSCLFCCEFSLTGFADLVIVHAHLGVGFFFFFARSHPLAPMCIMINEHAVVMVPSSGRDSLCCS